MSRILITAAIISSLALASCTTANTGKQLTGNTPGDTAFDRNAITCGKTMLEAFQKNDYALFSSGLSANLQKDFSRSDFESGRKHIIKSNGKISGYRYLGKLSGPVFTTFLWAVKFDRTNSEKENISRELLFKTTAGALDSCAETVSFGFTQ